MEEEVRMPGVQSPMQTDPNPQNVNPRALTPVNQELSGDNSEVSAGTFQEILAEGVGSFVSCEFLIGTQVIVAREGILSKVGVSYFILYDERYETSLMCDMYSLKFVTFYKPGRRRNIPGTAATTPYGTPYQPPYTYLGRNNMSAAGNFSGPGSRNNNNYNNNR